jgi:TolB-like protein
MVDQLDVRLERRLSAILVADVVGYSRLMHAREEQTHARLAALVADVVTPAVADHGGRIVKHTGDGFLAVFQSAVEAVRAAIQLQARVRDATADDPDEQRLVFRVGIHVGDIIVQPGDIFGDGVNIAARIEGLAAPGGIAISAFAYDQVLGKIDASFTELGEQKLKNISRPVRVYAVDASGREPAAASPATAAKAFAPPRLSIIVLPFMNIGGDAEQDYFADGLTESLTTDLSRMRGSFVIARNTAFTFKGKAIDVKAIGRELDVRYVLEGSVQRGGQRLRVNVQLIDAETGSHVWAERFEKPVTDLFDMQDEIVARLDAMDLIFQGIHLQFKGWTPDNLAQARALFVRALALDPDNASALLQLAIVNVSAVGSFMTDDRATLLAEAERDATRALSLAPDFALAHMILGAVYIVTNRAMEGIAECEQALKLDRNLADAHSCIGLAKFLLGRGEETEAHTLEALRLSPRDVYAYRWMYVLASAKFQIGATEEALTWLRRSIEGNRNLPVVHFTLAAVLALNGAQTQAEAAAQEGLALDPRFTVRRFQIDRPYDNAAMIACRDRLCEGMRKAGLPD